MCQNKLEKVPEEIITRRVSVRNRFSFVQKHIVIVTVEIEAKLIARTTKTVHVIRNHMTEKGKKIYYIIKD